MVMEASRAEYLAPQVGCKESSTSTSEPSSSGASEYPRDFDMVVLLCSLIIDYDLRI